jgi:hypothetical protein
VFARLEASLKGWPDTALTAGLLVTAAVLVLVALFGPSLLKAATLAWALFP